MRAHPTLMTQCGPLTAQAAQMAVTGKLDNGPGRGSCDSQRWREAGKMELEKKRETGSPQINCTIKG